MSQTTPVIRNEIPKHKRCQGWEEIDTSVEMPEITSDREHWQRLFNALPAALTRPQPLTRWPWVLLGLTLAGIAFTGMSARSRR